MLKEICGKKKQFQPSRLVFLITAVLSGYSGAATEHDYFNPELLEPGNPGAGRADLSVFESGDQAPGVYHVDIILNDQIVDSGNIDFSLSDGLLTPCLTALQLKAWGVKTEAFPELNTGDTCTDISAVPDIQADFQFSNQQLILHVPQAATEVRARGYVPPEQWDNGITAVMLNYSISGSQRREHGDRNNESSLYANLRPGMNIGAWRLRHYSTLSRNSAGQNKRESIYTYAQRSVIPLKAQLTIGDSTAPSDVFDSIPFRGGQLASDDDMMPDSLKGYAPVVRGIARSSSQVVIRQNGYQIYQAYVPAGAFEITDMYPTGGAGDLDVTVKGDDGSEQHFIVPFASLPVLQREGRLKFSVTGGQYRSYHSRTDKTHFAQVTGIYGLPRGFTVYGGIQESKQYQSLAIGAGKNMGGLGALSSDVILARAVPALQQRQQGQSWRLRYSKNFAQTGTNFTIAGYRYSTRGFYAMQEVLDSYGNNRIAADRRRSREELTLSQQLGENLGSLSVSAVKEDYWNSGNSMTSLSAGYNNTLGGISYGLLWTGSRNGRGGGVNGRPVYTNDQTFAVNISIPLNEFMPQTWANYSMNTDQHGRAVHTAGISGVAGKNNALSWNIQQGYGSDGADYTGSMNADYKGTYGEVNAGYSYDRNSERLSYGVQGGIVMHENGITLSQPLGETNVLVKAPGAGGVSVQNQAGSKTDFRGYTTVSNVMAFRQNDVTLDTETLPDNAEPELTTQTVVPTRGALVRADYRVSVGRRLLLTMTQKNGQPVPFGAVVTTVSSDRQGSITGRDGQVYLTGITGDEKLYITWGPAAAEKCTVRLKNISEGTGVLQADEACISDRSNND